jgi:hypothetical protein
VYYCAVCHAAISFARILVLLAPVCLLFVQKKNA